MIADGKIIYLDNNATTQLDPAVVEEMLPFLTEFYGNPSSGYQFAGQVRKAIDRARERVAFLLGCQASEIVFTSCGTESNNAAINSALQIDASRKHIVTTAVEHSAVLRHCQALTKRGCEVTFLRVDRDGHVDLGELEQAIRPDTAIVSVMWANNETGVLFPAERIAELCREKGVFFHTDAVQAAGKIPITLGESAINFLSLSAHKFHGPKGVGALYVKRNSRFQPSIIGGGQENGRRAGTENVASIVGLGKASERAAESIEEEQTRVRAMRDRFENGILEAVSGSSVNGDRTTRLPNTSSLSFDGIDSNAALLLLDRYGVCCSAGSACRTGSAEASHVRRAMYLNPDRARRSLRFSFGRFNSDSDVQRTLELAAKTMGQLRDVSGANGEIPAPGARFHSV
ncbi:MAG: cysteine desulfurase NifS [Chthoniobacterales bacterium]